MVPDLQLGPLSLTAFGLSMVVAFVAAYFQLGWGLRRLRVGDAEDASALILAAGVGGLLGAKLYYVALYRDWRLLFDRSGLVWYGGLLVGAAAVLWMARRRRLASWAVADAAAPSVALGYGIGRIGCFLVGDDYGMPTDLPWGVRIPYGRPAPTTAGAMREYYGAELPVGIPDDRLIPVHPTQLYETLGCLAIWAVGVWMLRRAGEPGRRRPGGLQGGVALAVFGLLAAERFAVEFVRAKDDRFFGELTLVQILSLAVLVAVAALWTLLRRRRAER